MQVGREYLELVLRLGQLAPGWVESYAGPPAVAERVQAAERLSAQELSERVQTLTQRVAEEVRELERRAWLSAQLHAISTALRWLGGERFTYGELFERCHGAQVRRVADEQFEQAHALLDQAFPGTGDVAVRYRAWRETQLVPREQLGQALELLAEAARERCRELFGMPDGESVTWELVTDRPWAANAQYAGRRRSLIAVNEELPIGAHRLLELVCHEAYPGHHTEQVCKEAILIQAGGREELAVFVYPSPQALITEGLACHALRALLGDGAETFAADRLRRIGIEYDADTASVVRWAEELLLPVRSNIALMLDGGEAPADARRYARAWLLDEPLQIDEAITHLEARSWRPYESCYPVGLALCSQYSAASPARFRDLLNRQLVPADLTG